MVYCIDIDGTLIASDFDGDGVGNYFNARPMQNRIDKVNKLYYDGNVIILYTGRHWNNLQITLKQLNDFGIKYHTVVCGKPVADLYIDDKAISDKDFFN